MGKPLKVVREGRGFANFHFGSQQLHQTCSKSWEYAIADQRNSQRPSVEGSNLGIVEGPGGEEYHCLRRSSQPLSTGVCEALGHR